MSIRCPECDANVSLPRDERGNVYVVEGEIVSCNECGNYIELYQEGNVYRGRLVELKGEDYGE